MKSKFFPCVIALCLIFVTHSSSGQAAGTYSAVYDMVNAIIGLNGDLTIANTMKTTIAWKKMDGLAKDIGIGANGSVWVLGPNSSIYRRQDNAWAQVQGGAERIGVDPSGAAWVVNLGGQIYKYNLRVAGAAYQPEWSLLPGLAQDIAVGVNGEVWIIGMQNEIAKWNGSSWSQISGGGKRIAVDDSGNPWVVNHGGQIWRYNGNTWLLLPGVAQDIGIGGSTVWIVGSDGMAYFWKDGAWVGMGAGYLNNISVDKSGMPWGTTASNTIYQSMFETVSTLYADAQYDADGKTFFIADDKGGKTILSDKKIVIKNTDATIALFVMYKNSDGLTISTNYTLAPTEQKTITIPAGSSGSVTFIGTNVASLSASGVWFPGSNNGSSPCAGSFDLASTNCVSVTIPYDGAVGFKTCL